MSDEGKVIVSESDASAVSVVDDKSSGSEQKSPTTSEPKSPQSITSDDKERTKASGLKVPSTSRIGRLCLAHQTPKAGPPPAEPRHGGNQSDETMSRLSDEYLRSPLADVCEENELDFLRGKFSRSSISPDNVLSRPPKADRKISNGSLGGDLYMEATGRRRSSDHGLVLTTDTDSFIIGQKVWVAGIRPGQIAYIGETHFAPGDWAGVVLDEPYGKNDGCVSGKRYFQCEPRKGIFSRLTRLTHYPLPNATFSKESSPSQHTRSILSPERSRATSPTSSIRSSMRKSPGKQAMSVGDRVIVSSGLGSRPGILKYLGETKFAQGTWCGVQLDDPTGKNDGSVDGIRYFECPSKYGVFVPIAKVTLSPSSRKSRLSRAGSRESLTSVGTLNSIATTNTSRLRMGVQRIPTATKLASAPKNTYSLQDVIREKQNHIEQLMIERDLDREDAQNQAMLFQKNIGELKTRVAELEKLLEDERKKTEELQYSIDEAQFCGDELNAQTQVYKEKIIELEQRLLDDDGNSTTESKSSTYTTEYDTLKKESEKLKIEVESLRNKLSDCAKDFEFKSRDLIEHEQQIQEEVEFLKQENEEMRKELLAKDESSEKMFLATQELQNALLEKTAATKKLDDEVEQTNLLLSRACNEKDEFIKQLQSEIDNLKNQIEISVKSTNDTSSSLSAIESEKKLLQDKLEEASKEIINLKNLIDTTTSSNEESMILVKDLKLEIEQLKKNNDQALEENSRLQTTVDTKSNEFSELCKRFELLEKGQEDTAKESASAKNQLSEVSNTIAVLESEIVLKEQEAETNKILIEELTKKVKALEENLKQKDESSSKLLLDTTAQSEALQKYQNDLQAIEKELQNASKNLSDKEDAVLKLTTDYEGKCKEIENINQEKAQLADLYKRDQEEKVKQITDLNIKVHELEQLGSDLKLLEDKYKQSESEKEHYSAEIEKMKNELNSLSSDNASKAIAIEDTQNQIKELTSRAIERQKHCEQLEISSKELKEQCESLKAVKSNYETKISELEIENGDKYRALEALSKKSDEISIQYRTLQQELLNLNNTTNDTNSEVMRLTESLVEKQKAHEILLDESNATKNKLERELQESAQCISSLHNEITSLKSEIESGTKTTSELQSQLESLKGSNENKGQIIDSIDQAIQSLTDNTQKVLAGNFSESEMLKSRLDIEISLQNKISALQSELETTRVKPTSTEASFLNHIKEYSKEKEKLLNEMKNLKDNEVNLQSLLEKQKETEQNSIHRLSTQLQTKDEEINSLNVAISTLTESSNSLNIKLAELEVACNDLRNSNEAIQTQLNSETTKTKDYIEQVERLRSVINEKDAEKEKITLNAAQLESQLASGEKDKASVLESLQQSKNQMEETITSLKKEILDKETEKCNIQAQLNKEQESLKNVRQNIDELTESLEVIKKQLLQKEDTIKAQTDNILHLNELVGQLQTDLQTNKQQMAEMISVYTNQIEILNKTLSQKTEECSNLLKSSIELKENNNSQAEQLSAKLTKELESQKALSAKYDALLRENDACKARIAELENLLTINTNTIEELTATVQSLELTLTANANRNSTVLKDYGKLQEDFDKLQKDKRASEQLLESEINKLKSDSNKPREINSDNLENSVEHINFLNSIIADMQKKNEGLKARIEAMEAVPLDFTTPEAFHIVGKRNPAPRLFCDICDIFDAHDTEECPLQSSDSPVSSIARSPSRIIGKENGEDENVKKLLPPRKFCDICDVFDAHETEECPLQCF